MASLYGATSATGWQLRLDYSATQSVENNASTVTMELYVYDGTGYSQNLDSSSCYYTLYDASRVYHPYTYSKTGWYKLGSRTVTVPHNADGTKTVTLSAAWYSGFTSAYTPSSLSVSGAVTLPAIPRASTMTAPAVITVGSACTLTIRRASSAFTHKITYSFAGATGTVASAAGDSATWTPPAALGAQIPDTTSATVTFTLTTYSGSTAIGNPSTCTATLRLPDYKPTASLADLTVVNDNATVRGWGVAVKGYSKLRWSASGNGQYGSAVTEYEVKVAGTGQMLSASSGTSSVLTAADGTVTVRVRDGRGKWSDAVSRSVSVYDYAPPTLTQSAAYRADSAGTPSDEGSYLAVMAAGSVPHSIGGRNSATLGWRLRVAGGGYGAGHTLTGGTQEVVNANLAAASSYDVEVYVEDTLGERRAVVYSIPTASVAFNLKSGGDGAAFGKYAERAQALEVPADWDFYRGGTRLMDLVYPVGSVYLSAVDVSPAATVGGTWTKIELLSGAYAWRRTG